MSQSTHTPRPVLSATSEYLSPVEDIIEEACNGRMFILVDDEDRVPGPKVDMEKFYVVVLVWGVESHVQSLGGIECTFQPSPPVAEHESLDAKQLAPQLGHVQSPGRTLPPAMGPANRARVM